MKKVRKLLSLMVLLVVTTGWAQTPTPSPPPIIVTNTNDSGPGSLRQALADANDGDSVQFDTSLYGQTITLTTDELAVDSDVTIIGPGPSLLTVSRSSSAADFGIFHVMPGRTSRIVGLTIRNGAGSFGFGIYNPATAILTLEGCTIRDNLGYGIYNVGSLTVNGCTIRDNLIGVYSLSFVFPGRLAILNSAVINNSGSGIYMEEGWVSLMNSVIDSNGGGGIYNQKARLDITDCSITNNCASDGGGGIYTARSFTTITNCTIKGNTAGSRGGGIAGHSYGAFDGVKIIGSTISNNSAGYGGGIENIGPTFIVNSTISGNTATDGGGIGTTDLALFIFNSTLSGNTATHYGDSIYNYGSIRLQNTILKSGLSGTNIFNDSGIVTSQGYNLSDDDGGGFLMGPGDQVNTNPMLGSLQDNGGPTFTHALLLGSPAINAGNPSFTPPPDTDQRGYARVYNGRIDVGSFEVQPTPTPACVLGSGYWMNHPQAWCMETIQIGCVNYSQAEAIAIMRHNAARDKTYNLAEQLIAAKLNIACKSTSSSCVSSAIAAANSWLCDHPVGSGVTANSSAWQQIKTTFNALVNYNSGTLCAQGCPDAFN